MKSLKLTNDRSYFFETIDEEEVQNYLDILDESREERSQQKSKLDQENKELKEEISIHPVIN